MNLFITIYTKSLILLLLHFLTTLLLNVSQLLSHVQVPHVELLHHALVHLRHLPQVDCARGLKIVRCEVKNLKIFQHLSLSSCRSCFLSLRNILSHFRHVDTSSSALSQILAGTTRSQLLSGFTQSQGKQQYCTDYGHCK